MKKFKISFKQIIAFTVALYTGLAMILLFTTVRDAHKRANAFVEEINNAPSDVAYVSSFDIKPAANANISDSDIMTADTLFNLMPENVKDHVLSHNITIVITDGYSNLDTMSDEHNSNTFKKDNSKEMPNLHTVGLTQNNFDRPVILIYNEYLHNALIHEIGHAVDITANGNVFFAEHNKKEFKTIYEEEASYMVPVGIEVTGYVISTPDEYFAECFHQYIMFPDTLRESAPKTYAYMERFVASL